MCFVSKMDKLQRMIVAYITKITSIDEYYKCRQTVKQAGNTEK